jgi:iron complex outermembrane receptor protein
LNNRLDIAYNFAYTSGERMWANHDNFYRAMRSNPTVPIYTTPDHADYERFGGFFELPDFSSRNPVSDIMQTTNDQKDQVMLGNVRATLSILPNLRFSTTYSNQTVSVWNGSFRNSTLRGFEPPINGRAEQSQRHEVQQVIENTLHFMNDWGAHTFQVLLGQSYETNLRHGFNVHNTNFPMDRVLYNRLEWGEGIMPREGRPLGAGMDSFKFRDKLAAGFARVLYNYDGRYFLSASTRIEGSSKFGRNAHPVLGPWGVFPAVSASWNIMGEEFMRDVNLFQDLRMRLGYGVTGNMPEPSYLHAMIVDRGDGQIFSDGEWIFPWGPATNQNERIRWEKKHEYNLGVDFAMLNNRLSGSIDTYFRNTTDLLWEYIVRVPPHVREHMWDNHGQIHNYGVELLLTGNVVRQRDLNWDLTLTAAWNDNRVVQITSGHQYAVVGQVGWHRAGEIEGGDGETGNFVMRLEEGQPIGNFWGYKLAFIEENGTRVYHTPAGGYTRNPEDRHKMILGNAQPLVIFGLGSNLRYRQFDVVMNFHGRIGGLIFNETRYFLEHPTAENSLRSTFEGDNMRWVQGIIREIQESGSDDGSNSRMAQRLFSDHYLESATFLQLGDLTIGYRPRLSASLSDYINNLRISFTAQNLFTLTAYSGDNPAAVRMSGLAPGFDRRSFYPMPRSFNLGLAFNF